MKQQSLSVEFSPICESLFDDEFRNEYGAIRNCFVRSHYFSGRIALPDVVDLFCEWRDDHEYFILRKNDKHFQVHITTEDHDLYEIPTDGMEYVDGFLYKFIQASKRGNPVYQYLVSKKLKPLEELEDVTFFRDDWGRKRTNLLFVTLTYDTKRCDEDTAWKNIGNDFHLFVNNLRKRYKSKIEIFRVWESTKNYYPHIHCLLAFHGNPKFDGFEVFIHEDKDGSRSYRIPKKEKDIISKYWHSHIDVQGCEDTQGSVNELAKYVTKDLCSDKGNKTNAMIWLHRKQGYSISKNFVGVIKGCFGEVVDLREPRTTDLIYDNMANCNSELEKWEFVGILRGVDLGFSRDVWSCDVKKPPPRVADLLNREYVRWKSRFRNR